MKHTRSIGSASQALILTSLVTGGVSQAQESWTARYDGPGKSAEVATDVVVDPAGNVYVTGSSDGAGTGPDGTDIATVKYDPAGNQLWVARYNGPGNNWDEAYSIAVDDAGNVYVAGTSTGMGTAEDYATIKYDSNGNELWVRRYDGPVSYEDAAYSMTVDASGNVYVTGWSSGTGPGAKGLDFATIKYDANGNELWVRRYDGPGIGEDRGHALFVNPAGEVIVTGSSVGNNSGNDYATVKYDASGVELWTSRYDGPGSGQDRAYGLAVDAAGNVHVTGYSDGTGAGPDGWDCATVKYDAGGNELWVARYDGPGKDWDEAWAIAVNSVGAVHVTGGSIGAGASGWDYVTLKYDAAGTELWAARYDGPGGGFDEAFDLVLDGAGGVYVTGGSEGPGGSTDDYATVHYAVDGTELWVARYDGTAHGLDDAYAIAYDPSGQVVVAGASQGAASKDDYTTLRMPTLGLYVDRDEVSLANGGQVSLALGAGPSSALRIYLVLGSAIGTSPGIPVDQVTLPLVPGSYFLYTLTNPNSPPFAGSFGTLDADGRANTSWTLPPGSNPAAAGLVLHHAYAVFDTTAIPGAALVSYASNPAPFALAP